mmetsp:Transcript_10451/g.29605  ORF Transcript_10451/g.29605 Transcript_10451/m.29605 type:complete len:136 (-) Transcript_10451:433-840(-)
MMADMMDNATDAMANMTDMGNMTMNGTMMNDTMSAEMPEEAAEEGSDDDGRRRLSRKLLADEEEAAAAPAEADAAAPRPKDMMEKVEFTLPNGTVIETTRIELAYNKGLQEGFMAGYKDGYADGQTGAEPKVPLE